MLETYHFLRDEIGARYIQLIPIVERVTPEILPLANLGWSAGGAERPLYLQQGNLVTDRTVSADQWGRFLIEMFDEWIRFDVGKVFVQMFDSALASWVGAPAALCIFAETCGHAVALEHVDRPMRIMADLLRRGRYADEVMGILAAESRQAVTSV
jgi:uncharacterized protein